MKLRIAALLSLTTAVHGDCDVTCDGFDDSLTIDMASIMGMSMSAMSGSEDAGPGAGRTRLLQLEAAGMLMGGPQTCAELRAMAASSEDEASDDETACAMSTLLAYRFCGCAGDPPPGSCYACPDGSPLPDLGAVPVALGMDLDTGMGAPQTCGDLAFQMSFSTLLVDVLANAFGDMSEGFGAMGGEDAEHGHGGASGNRSMLTNAPSVDCVPVNHQYDNPGEVTCDCVEPQDDCLASGGCVPDESCAAPHMHTDDAHMHTGDDMDMGDMGDMGDIDMCGVVGAMCGCSTPDACEVCPLGLQEPGKVVEADGDSITCEQGLAQLSAGAAMMGLGCDEIAAMAAGVGCYCAGGDGADGADACDTCPFGLQEPGKVVDADEVFTCEQGLQRMNALVGSGGMDCDGIAARAAEAGCLCKAEADAGVPEVASPAGPAATNAPSPAEPATTNETPAATAGAPGANETPAAPPDAPGANETPVATPAAPGANETPVATPVSYGAGGTPAAPGAGDIPAATPDAPDEDEDPDDSGARSLGIFVVTLLVAVGVIILG